MYDIRLAHETDGKALIQFIDQHWKKNHIFVTCNEMLDWQHLDRTRGRYNFIIGIEKRTQEIHAMLGFIPLSQFDPEIENERFCWLAIWKVREEARGHKLGRGLLSYFEATIKPDVLAGLALSEMVVPLYRARGYQIGQLSHYFILNPEKSSFHLVTMKGPGQIRAITGTRNAEKKIEESSESDITNGAMDCFLAQKDLPRKSPNFLINRYFRHPIYRYQVYRIREARKTTGVIVTRVCRHAGSCAIRIVDFIGPSDALRGLQDQWTLLLKNINAEYLDFYNAGIDDADLLASGFTRRKAGDDIAIPNYFEPFSKENVEIDYMLHAPGGQTCRFVKGDSDQDRPNFSAGTLP